MNHMYLDSRYVDVFRTIAGFFWYQKHVCGMAYNFAMKTYVAHLFLARDPHTLESIHHSGFFRAQFLDYIICQT